MTSPQHTPSSRCCRAVIGRSGHAAKIRATPSPTAPARVMMTAVQGRRGDRSLFHGMIGASRFPISMSMGLFGRTGRERQEAGQGNRTDSSRCRSCRCVQDGATREGADFRESRDFRSWWPGNRGVPGRNPIRAEKGDILARAPFCFLIMISKTATQGTYIAEIQVEMGIWRRFSDFPGSWRYVARHRIPVLPGI